MAQHPLIPLNIKNHSFIAIAVAFVLLSVGCAIVLPPESAHADTLNLSKVTKADIVKTIEHLQKNNDDAQTQLKITQVQLYSSQDDVKNLNVAIKKVQDDRDWWKADDGKKDTIIQAKDKTIETQKETISSLQAWLSKLGLVLAGAAAAITFLLIGALVPAVFKLTPYYWIARAVASAAAFAAVFAWVRYIR